LFGLDDLEATVVTVVLVFELRWGYVAARGGQLAVVEPVDPFHGGQLELTDLATTIPGCLSWVLRRRVAQP